MIKKILALTILQIIILINSTVYCSELDQKVDQLNKELKTVEAGTDTYEQSIQQSSDQPCKVILKTIKKDKRGNTTEILQEFNLADINVHLVNEKVKGKLMTIQLPTKEKLDMVKYYKNQETDKYDNTAEILAFDIDNARKIIEIFKKAIPLAEKIMEKSLNLTSYNQMINWLVENVKDAHIDSGISYIQKFEKDDTFPSKVLLHTTINSSKSAVNQQIAVNLSDINTFKIDFKATKKIFSINLKTKNNLKVIKVIEDGKQKNYTNDFDIIVDDIEDARQIRNVFKKIVPLAEKEAQKLFPKSSNSFSATASQLEKYVTDVTINDENYKQNLKPECITQFIQTVTTSKGSSEEKAIFNLSDLNENDIELKIKGTKLFVEASTNAKTKLIKKFKNADLDNYTNNIEILTPDVESARLLMHHLKQIIPLCRQKTQVVQGNAKAKLQWIINQLHSVNTGKYTYEQTLEFVENTACKLRLKTAIADAKKSKELIYEFNVSDLDHTEVEFHIKGTEMSVKLATKHKEKYIKTYQDGESHKFINEVLLRFEDTEIARQVIETFKSVIPLCKE